MQQAYEIMQFWGFDQTYSRVQNIAGVLNNSVGRFFFLEFNKQEVLNKAIQEEKHPKKE